MGKTFGLTNQQIIGMSATLADLGISAELSTTAMSRVFNKMLSNTQRITEVLKLDFDEFSNALRDKPIKAVEMFLQRLSMLDKVNVVEALNEMRLRSTGATQTILKLSSSFDKLQKNIRVTEEAYRKGTATSKEFHIIQNTLDGATQKLTSSYKDMNYQLGVVLKPIMIKGINLLSSMADFVGRNAKEFSVLVGVIGTLTVGVKALSLAMSLSPFGRMIAGVTALSTAIVYAYDKLKALYNLYKRNNAEMKEYYSKEAIAKRKAKALARDYERTLKGVGSTTKAISRLSKAYDSAIKEGDIKKASAYKNALDNLTKSLANARDKVKRLKNQIPKEIRTRIDVKVHVNRPKIPHYRIDYTPPTVRVEGYKPSHLAYSKTNLTYTKPTREKTSNELQSYLTSFFKTNRITLKPQIDKEPLDNFIKENDNQVLNIEVKLKKIDSVEKKYTQKEIEDFIAKNTLKESDYLLRQLNEDVKRYKEAGIKKQKIEEYFNIKYKEILKKRQEEYGKVLEAQKQASIKAIDEQLKEYRKFHEDISKLDFGNIFISSIKRVGFDSEIAKQITNISNETVKNIVAGIQEYQSSGKFTVDFKNAIGGILSNAAYGATDNDSSEEKKGKVIGTTAGAVIGSYFGSTAIGGAIGTFLGGAIGRAIHGFFKDNKTKLLPKEEIDKLNNEMISLRESMNDLKRAGIKSNQKVSNSLLSLVRTINKDISDRSNSRNIENKTINLDNISKGKSYDDLKRNYEAYSKSITGNSYIDIINLAIARNRVIEAGVNLDRQRELTLGEDLTIRNLKNMDLRLKNIEKLLRTQNELQTKIEKNTYQNTYI